MNASDFLLKKYPHVVGLMLDEEGSINTEISLGEILEEYHREKMEEDGFIELVVELASQEERERILGIIDKRIDEINEKTREQAPFADYRQVLIEREVELKELIEKIKG